MKIFSNLLLLLLLFTAASTPGNLSPVPKPWPERFHALLYMNLTDAKLQLSDLWYDWPRGRNVNIFQKQLGVLLYDIEWDNGTSFYYTLGGKGQGGSCEVMEFEVGIPRPNFLDGAEYLGTEVADGFLCNVWQKVNFIWYYEDVETQLPVRWDFYDGISSHVMKFEANVALPDSITQAPPYCFGEVQLVKKMDVATTGVNGDNVIINPFGKIRRLIS
ncbi:hypothetical protein MLD38_006440 [Melastoma candidum]|uniref:Uncharacterized protein n=1 Tax=Melastoma candidum TaxID=119954 RepID=A0ACB9RNF1_9MYRT|nr:hypothetical protein MLD38_006440 [Melastoma candidum]